MHKTLVFVIFSLQSSIFHHRTERFVKFDAVLHHDLNSKRKETKKSKKCNRKKYNQSQKDEE